MKTQLTISRNVVFSPTMKYIIVEDMGLEQAIVFNEILTHTAVAGTSTVISAGFCSFSVDDDRLLAVNCWGQSTSLGTPSRGQVDADLILQAIKYRI